MTAAEIIKMKSQIIAKKGGRDYSNDPNVIKKGWNGNGFFEKKRATKGTSEEL